MLGVAKMRDEILFRQTSYGFLNSPMACLQNVELMILRDAKGETFRIPPSIRDSCMPGLVHHNTGKKI